MNFRSFLFANTALCSFVGLPNQDSQVPIATFGRTEHFLNERTILGAALQLDAFTFAAMPPFPLFRAKETSADGANFAIVFIHIIENFGVLKF